MNIRSRRYDLGLEMGDHGQKLLDDDVVLMEIKTALAKPMWLVQMLTQLNIQRDHFSKYGTEFRRYVTNAEMQENKYEEVV